MLSKKDRFANTNFGYTFNRWNYKPSNDKMNIEHFNKQIKQG